MDESCPRVGPRSQKPERGHQASKHYLLDVQKHMVDIDFLPATDFAVRERDRHTLDHVSH